MSRVALGCALACSILGACFARVDAPELSKREVETRRTQLGPSVIAEYRNRKARLMEIENRIRIANAPLCGPLVIPEIGVIVADENTFEVDSIQEIASDALRIEGERATVVHIVPGGAFERAGGRLGDAMADEKHASMSEFVLEQVENPRAGQSVTLPLLREGKRIDLQVRPDVACAVRGVFSQEGVLLPWQHDRFVSAIPVGALRYLDDHELAILISHQLAHALVDLAQTSPDDAERVADRVGLFMAARARFDASLAPKLWRDVAAEYPSQIEGTGLHGRIAERLPAVEATVSEIRALRSANKALHPGRF